jgi:Flp pilus assembly protein TadG
MSTLLRLPSWTRRFVRDARGVSAVEFALLLPLMLTLYLGGTEITQAISASRKVTLVSRTVADLTSQSSSITNAQMTAMLDASAAVVSPFPSTTLKVTVSQVKIDANGAATVEWSDTRGGTVRGVGTSVVLPPALVVNNTWLIFTEAEYTYEPAIGHVITGPLALRDKMYMRPRQSSSVTRTS